jgi:hypothetical protein
VKNCKNLCRISTKSIRQRSRDSKRCCCRSDDRNRLELVLQRSLRERRIVRLGEVPVRTPGVANELVMSMYRPPCSVRRRQSSRTVQSGSQRGNQSWPHKSNAEQPRKTSRSDQSRQAKQTLKQLPKKTRRQALGKQAAKVRPSQK